MKLTAILLLSLTFSCISLGCGYGSNYNGMNGAAPRIAQLSPQNVVAGSGAFTLTIAGSNLTSGSIVYWNTTVLNAAYNSAAQITVPISATMVANAGSVSIRVHTDGGDSNTVMFNIN